MKRTALTALAALVATTLSWSGSTDVVSADRTEPVVVMQATARRATVYRMSGGTIDYRTLGLWLSAPSRAFEVQVTRPYAGTAVTRLVAPRSDGGTRVLDVPFDGFDGLTNFFQVEVATTDGTRIRRFSLDLCPDNQFGARLNNVGPNEPTYPLTCVPSLWTRGYTYGVDAGWSVPVVSATPGEPGDILQGLPDGTYLVTATITPPWRRALRIPVADATAMIDARLTTIEGFGRTDERNATTDARSDGLFTTASSEARSAPTNADRRRAPARSTLPDLAALPAWGAITLTIDDRDLLAFSANVSNVGNAPLIVEGYRAPGADLMRAFQFFYADGAPVGSKRVGGMEYDPREGHEHWHFLDFAAYDLLGADRAKIERSGKEAFCLAPTDAIDLTLRHADLRPEATGLSGACGDVDSRWIRQVLPVGWGDTYVQFLPGQSFDITDLPNGTYYIRVTANPDGRLHELTDRNNVALRRVVIGGEAGARTVRVPPWRGMDTEFDAIGARQLREAASRHGVTVTRTTAAEETSSTRSALLADPVGFICRIPQ